MNHTRHDTLLNTGLIAAGIVGLLLAVIDGPAPGGLQMAALIVTEANA